MSLTVAQDAGEGLKACPFCGFMPVRVWRNAILPSMDTVLCDNCHARGPHIDGTIVAIAAWNTRHPAEPATEQASGMVEETFLNQLRRVNTERYHAWIGDDEDAGILFDAAELGGEVGELLNVVKKLVREDAGWRGSRAAPGDFADECGDVLICLDKLARRRGVDLEAATIAKFNATSNKVGLPHKLSARPPSPTGSRVEDGPK